MVGTSYWRERGDLVTRTIPRNQDLLSSQLTWHDKHHGHGHSLQRGGGGAEPVVQVTGKEKKRLRDVPPWGDTWDGANTELECEVNRFGRLLLLLLLCCRYNHEVLENMSGSYAQIHTIFTYVKRLYEGYYQYFAFNVTTIWSKI